MRRLSFCRPEVSRLLVVHRVRAVLASAANGRARGRGCFAARFAGPGHLLRRARQYRPLETQYCLKGMRTAGIRVFLWSRNDGEISWGRD